jgi:hypothetical protein
MCLFPDWTSTPQLYRIPVYAARVSFVWMKSDPYSLCMDEK